MLRALGQEIGAGQPVRERQPRPKPSPDGPPEDDEEQEGEVGPGRYLAPHPLLQTSDQPDSNAPLPAYHPRVSGSMDMAASTPGDERRITSARGNLSRIFN